MSTSLFDLLEPQEPQGGLSGLALNLRQRGPSGLGEALGAGLLNVSAMAQGIQPQVIEAAGQRGVEGPGFGTGLLTGFLGSIGAPARAAVSAREKQEAATRELQGILLREGFRDLTPEAKESLFASIGLPADFEAEPSIFEREALEGLIKIASDRQAAPEDRSQAVERISLNFPEIASAFGGMTFTQAPPEASSSLFNAMSDVYTGESLKRFFNPEDKANYTNWQALQAIPEKARGARARALSPRDEQAVADRERVIQTASKFGVSLDEAENIAFAGDARGRANYDRYFGVGVGSLDDPTSLAVRVGSDQLLFSLLPIDEKLRLIGEAAKGIKEIRGQVAKAPTRSPLVKPEAPAGPIVRTWGNYAFLQAMKELGVSGAEEIETQIELEAKVRDLMRRDPTLFQAIEMRTDEIFRASGADSISQRLPETLPMFPAEETPEVEAEEEPEGFPAGFHPPMVMPPSP